ncbi:melanoma-derived growth regulatory protein isoform X5 [Ursus maritimus]|uniref:Melanoma-derived growth regulatory protein isoform X5 n=1 Tax=Ursus maritimus TaxID=29073 RepID=A0A8M1G2T1_URSMA|nr:melanoma-derived growth regulatory protein isoform X5 [Ursus maritimus]
MSRPPHWQPQGLVSGAAPCPSWLTASCVLMRNAAVRAGGWGAWGLGLPARVEGAVIPFYSFPRPHLHGRGPSGLHGPRLPFPDHTQGPSCVQGDYYGDLAARLGYFPSSVVREDQTLKPGKIDVKTDKWDFFCQ